MRRNDKEVDKSTINLLDTNIMLYIVLTYVQDMGLGAFII